MTEYYSNVLTTYRTHKKIWFYDKTHDFGMSIQVHAAHAGRKNIETTICSENEHIGEIKRTNRTVKELCQGIYNTLPFKQLPGQMIAEMVYAAVFWLNAFHPNRDLLHNLSPRLIMT